MATEEKKAAVSGAAEGQAKAMAEKATGGKTTPELRGQFWEKHSFLREVFQNLWPSVFLFRRPGSEGGATKEKHVPNWFLSIFPKLTRDDNNEYVLCLTSASKEAREAAKNFRRMMEEEKIYDPIKYVVELVFFRREFMDQLKHPPGENKGSDRLGFQKITIGDPVLYFFEELAEEEAKGGTPEEIYERQKKHARDIDVLPKIHWIKKYKLEIFIGMFMIPWAIWQLIVWYFS